MDYVCGTCGEEARAKCEKCRAIRYCGAKCQRKDWPVHGPECAAWTVNANRRAEWENKLDELSPLRVAIVAACLQLRELFGPGMLYIARDGDSNVLYWSTAAKEQCTRTVEGDQVKILVRVAFSSVANVQSRLATRHAQELNVTMSLHLEETSKKMMMESMTPVEKVPGILWCMGKFWDLDGW